MSMRVKTSRRRFFMFLFSCLPIKFTTSDALRNLVLGTEKSPSTYIDSLLHLCRNYLKYTSCTLRRHRLRSNFHILWLQTQR